MNSFQQLFCKFKIFINRLEKSVDSNIVKFSAELKLAPSAGKELLKVGPPQLRSRGNNATAQVPLASPRILSIMVTEQCNLKCLYCLRSAGNEGREIPWPILKRVILSAYRSGITAFSITGGEILVYPYWRDFVKLVGSLRASFSMESNGYNLTEEDIIFLKNTLHGRIGRVLISLDSDRAEINDLFRGKGSYEKAVEAIRLLRKHNIPVEINTLITPLNLMGEKDILNYINFAKKLGVTEVVLGEAVALGRAKDKRFLLNENQRKGVSRILIKHEFFKNDQEIRFRAGPFLPSAIIQSCQRLGKEISVSPYGLHPCVFHINNIKIGDFQDFEKLLHSKFLESLFYTGTATQQCFKGGRFYSCSDCVKRLPEWFSVVSKNISVNFK
jgi:MoaA/NifB/PqqE/SkfB family radical SAM enzyme